MDKEKLCETEEDVNTLAQLMAQWGSNRGPSACTGAQQANYLGH